MIKEFIKSIFGGIFISLGCIAYLSSDNKLIGSILFSIGLLSIVCFKQKLFTGVICDLINNGILYCIMIYIGNIIGCLFMSELVLESRLKDKLIERANIIIQAKSNDSLDSLVTLGMLCELCIFIGVTAGRYNEQYSIISIILAVTIFVYCGFEHCIADWFYCLLTNSGNNILFPVTLGNTIMGIILSIFNYNYKTSES